MSKSERTDRVSGSGGPSEGTVAPGPSFGPQDVSEGIDALDRTYGRSTVSGVCVADGFGVRMTVERGALTVSDGVGPYRRSRRFDRATHGLARLVVLASTGSVTLEALAWCRKLGIGVLIVDHTGTAVLASTPRVNDDARIRRTQAFAVDRAVGLDIARYLLGGKLTGQTGLLRRRFNAGEAADTIDGLSEALAESATIEKARQLEAVAAAVYFGTWASRPECVPRFAARDRTRVPPHWRRFEGRRSVLSSGNTNGRAERPINGLTTRGDRATRLPTDVLCQPDDHSH